jgi:threonine dehydrogenase-like Zn-dependent dehydrogenase
MAMIVCRRVSLSPLVTHHFALDDIQQAYDLFSHQDDGVLKVALYPNRADVPVDVRRQPEVVEAR